MKISAPHPVFAWLLDVWLFSVLLQGAMNASQPRANFGSEVVALTVLGMGTALLAAYHKWWSASARFLSLGEAVAGRIRVADGKLWVNPYGESRVFLYGCMCWALFVRVHIGLSGMRWDATSWSDAMSGGLLGFMFIAIAAASMILLGRGWSWGLLGVLAFRLWSVSTAVLATGQPFSKSIVHFAPVYGDAAILVAMCVPVAFSYSAARRRTIVASPAA